MIITEAFHRLRSGTNRRPNANVCCQCQRTLQPTAKRAVPVAGMVPGHPTNYYLRSDVQIKRISKQHIRPQLNVYFFWKEVVIRMLPFSRVRLLKCTFYFTPFVKKEIPFLRSLHSHLYLQWSGTRLDKPIDFHVKTLCTKDTRIDSLRNCKILNDFSHCLFNVVRISDGSNK